MSECDCLTAAELAQVLGESELSINELADSGGLAQLMASISVSCHRKHCEADDGAGLHLRFLS